MVSLDVGDVEILREGLRATLRRSKTDQEAAGRDVAIPYGSNPDTCPIRALQAWLQASGIAEGPLWRAIDKGGRLQSGRLSDRAVALIVKRALRQTTLRRLLAEGVPKQQAREQAAQAAASYAGHSLRSGLATVASAAGVRQRVIMEQTGHKSVQTVRRYIRRGKQFTENAAGMVGLQDKESWYSAPFSSTLDGPTFATVQSRTDL